MKGQSAGTTQKPNTTRRGALAAEFRALRAERDAYIDQLEQLFAEAGMVQALWRAHPGADIAAALETVLESADNRRAALAAGDQ